MPSQRQIYGPKVTFGNHFKYQSSCIAVNNINRRDSSLLRTVRFISLKVKDMYFITFFNRTFIWDKEINQLLNTPGQHINSAALKFIRLLSMRINAALSFLDPGNLKLSIMFLSEEDNLWKPTFLCSYPSVYLSKWSMWLYLPDKKCIFAMFWLGAFFL